MKYVDQLPLMLNFDGGEKSAFVAYINFIRLLILCSILDLTSNSKDALYTMELTAKLKAEKLLQTHIFPVFRK